MHHLTFSFLTTPSNQGFSRVTNILFFLLLIPYTALIIVFNLDLIDSGFLVSFVGRLDYGQILYKDFDIVRPPASIILWDFLLSLFSKDSPYLLLIIRTIFIFEVLLVGFISTKIILKNKTTFLSVLVIAICLLHNFNLMPWHTVDGILFGMLAIYFFSKDLFFSAVVLATISAGTKQSFYLFPAAVLLASLWSFMSGAKKFRKLDGSLGFLLLCLSSIVILKYKIFQNITLILQQTNSSSNISQFITVGIKSYFFSTDIATFGFITILFATIFYKCTFIDRNAFKASTLFLLLFYIGPLFNNGNFTYSNQLFLLYFAMFLRYKKNDLVGWLLFLLGWCSSISWGYNQPTFLLAISYFYTFHEKLKYKHILRIGLFVLITMFLTRLKNPYFNAGPQKTEYIWSKKLPIISGMYIPKDIYDYYTEAYRLMKENDDIIFIPGAPLVDVMNSSYLNRSSWEMDVEYPNYRDDLKQLANKKHLIFAVDRKPILPIDKGFFKSTYTSEIIKNSRKIDSTRYFYIYEHD